MYTICVIQNAFDDLSDNVEKCLWIGEDHIGKDGGVEQYDIEVRGELEGCCSVLHHVKSAGHLTALFKVAHFWSFWTVTVSLEGTLAILEGYLLASSVSSLTE